MEASTVACLPLKPPRPCQPEIHEKYRTTACKERTWCAQCAYLPLGGFRCACEWLAYLSGTSRRCQHGANSHFSGVFSTFGLMYQNVVTSGLPMCMLFEICAKRPFQKCMGWGGGYVVTILSPEL